MGQKIIMKEKDGENISKKSKIWDKKVILMEVVVVMMRKEDKSQQYEIKVVTTKSHNIEKKENMSLKVSYEEKVKKIWDI